jgi:hypothetical protein
VALAGNLLPNMGVAAHLPDKWQVDVIDQQTGEGEAVIGGNSEDWPPFFNALPSLAAS